MSYNEDLDHPANNPPCTFNRLKDYYNWVEECEEYEKINQIKINIYTSKKNNKVITDENEESNHPKNNKTDENEVPDHPKNNPPLHFNRLKDYYNWVEECKEYEKK